MALRLYAICNHDDLTGELPEGTRLINCRDLSAVVGDAPYVAQLPDAPLLEQHRAIVDWAFHKGEVLPAPPGAVFRTTTALERWMDLHYVTLSDGLAFVADRIAARVHISRREGDDAPADAGVDLAAVSAEVMRTLRRRAVASVSLRREHTTGLALGSAFLVERSLWREFRDEAEAVREAHEGAEISMTGPWPPYDFVRIEFGG